MKRSYTAGMVIVVLATGLTACTPPYYQEPGYYQQPGYHQQPGYYRQAPPAFNTENCGTPDEPKPCPPMPRVPLQYYPANRQ